jgi:hypothetical protein
MPYKDGKYYDWEGNEVPDPKELITDTDEINKRREIDSRDPRVQKAAEELQKAGRQIRKKRKQAG